MTSSVVCNSGRMCCCLREGMQSSGRTCTGHETYVASVLNVRAISIRQPWKLHSTHVSALHAS
jgi:hypothetical protein